jgi:hypothetical protein
MTICETCAASAISTAPTKIRAKSAMAVTRNEEFWVEVIREASRDSDPPPALHRVQKLRAIFRE